MSNFKALIPRLRKTSLVYLPINFLCVIGLIFFHTKIFSPNVPESFVLKLIAQTLKLIFPWAFFYSHALYSILDTNLLKEPSDSDKDIELGPLPSKPTPSVTPTPVEETPPKNLPPVSVPNDLGEGPSSRPYGVEESSLSEFVDIDLGEGPSSRPYGTLPSEFVVIDLGEGPSSRPYGGIEV
ncbi:hypothetical protein DFH28DRAFT_965942 [Melampsora americana]|nr:hypothetical protein DFH28DRAFT_965942 [Melampsora americana]